jgi:hypothetical protein
MKQLTKKQRLRHYIILGGLVLAVPVVVSLLCIILTGGVTNGLGMAVVPSVFLVHFIFGQVFFKDAGYEKLPVSVFTGFVAQFLFWGIVLVMPGFMPFGLALLLGFVLFIVFSALFWEGIYRIMVWMYGVIEKIKS